MTANSSAKPSVNSCTDVHASMHHSAKASKNTVWYACKECRLLVHAIWLHQHYDPCCKEVVTQACDELPDVHSTSSTKGAMRLLHKTQQQFSEKATGHTCQSSSVSIPIILRRGSLDACNSSLGSGGAMSCITGVPMPKSSLGSEFICKARPENKNASQLLISSRTECSYRQSAGCASMSRWSDATATAVSSEAGSLIGALHAIPLSM